MDLLIFVGYNRMSSHGFVDYHDRTSASLAIMRLNGRQSFGQPIKVNWAYASCQRKDTSDHFNILIGDLSPEGCKGYVGSENCPFKRLWVCFFRNQQDAQNAINDMTVDGTKKADPKAHALKAAKAVKAGASPIKKKVKNIKTSVTFHGPRTLKTDKNPSILASVPLQGTSLTITRY